MQKKLDATPDKAKTIESSVDTSRREFVAKTIKASAFAVPLALGVDTITARKVHAQAQSDSGGAQQSQSGGGLTGGEQSSAASVSEPAVVTLLGLGLASMALEARRRNKKQS